VPPPHRLAAAAIATPASAKTATAHAIPTPPPPTEREPPLVDPWRNAKYLSQCVSIAAVWLAVAFASTAALQYVFKPSSDMTIVFDSGGTTMRDANPSVPCALGSWPLLLPLAALSAVATLVLTSVSSCVPN
jgi:hypothetical protein